MTDKTTTNNMTDVPSGFQTTTPFDIDDVSHTHRNILPSRFSKETAIECAQLIELMDGEGSILYYPRYVVWEVGDVLFLRERSYIENTELSPVITEEEENQQLQAPNVENGIVVQIITKGTANYPQADVKALFRLMTRARASLLHRSYNEPTEVMDDFLTATFKIRASIVGNVWRPPEGKVVNRNVDIFLLDPKTLCDNILVQETNLNINLGSYKNQPVEFFGGGFDKVNLITGMKGAGKSHIAKGVISECLEVGMSAIVFDINNEYHGLPNSVTLTPSKNLKFRLDRISAKSLIDMIERIAPFAERTGQYVRAELPGIIEAHSKSNYLDIAHLKAQAENIIKGKSEAMTNMRNSYKGSLNALDSYSLIMTAQDIAKEMEYIKQVQVGETPNPLDVMSLSSVLSKIEYEGQPSVIIFSIGGLLPFIQKVVVSLVIDTLKAICEKQTKFYEDKKIVVPNYPTIYFEEAHMYMESQFLDELIPLIRHYGMNLFFITNTPGALPDSVFRLVDNVIMTKMLNKQDIDQVKHSGLTDAETIEGFARELPKYHALFLSGIEGTTKNFPLVFSVRNFALPPSGVTRSMWQAMKKAT